MDERRNRIIDEYPCDDCVWYSTITLNNGLKFGRRCYIMIDAVQEERPIVNDDTGRCDYYDDKRKLENQ